VRLRSAWETVGVRLSPSPSVRFGLIAQWKSGGFLIRELEVRVLLGSSAEVVELADTYVRDAYGFGRAGSTPAFRTRFFRGVAQREGHQSPKLACAGSNPVAPVECGCSSIGRAFDCQSRGRGFEPRYPHYLSAGMAKLASAVGSNPIGLDGPWGFDSPSRHSSTGALGKRSSRLSFKEETTGSNPVRPARFGSIPAAAIVSMPSRSAEGCPALTRETVVQIHARQLLEEFLVVGVAQLEEHPIVIRAVTGSNPVTHPRDRTSRGDVRPSRLHRDVRSPPDLDP
jgi:hypothetical protein